MGKELATLTMREAISIELTKARDALNSARGSLPDRPATVDALSFAMDTVVTANDATRRAFALLVAWKKNPDQVVELVQTGEVNEVPPKMAESEPTKAKGKKPGSKGE